jgi:hypothetical protein
MVGATTGGLPLEGFGAVFRPPSPPILGGTGVQSPPELGDLGGEKDFCGHGRLKSGNQEKLPK